MPPQIRNVAFAQAVVLLQRFGYRQVRQTGSHVRMVNAAGNEITLTNHGSRPIHAGTMGRTVAQAGINPDHFLWGLGRADRRGRRRTPRLAAGSARLDAAGANSQFIQSQRCAYDYPSAQSDKAVRRRRR